MRKIINIELNYMLLSSFERNIILNTFRLLQTSVVLQKTSTHDFDSWKTWVKQTYKNEIFKSSIFYNKNKIALEIYNFSTNEPLLIAQRDIKNYYKIKKHRIRCTEYLNINKELFTSYTKNIFSSYYEDLFSRTSFMKKFSFNKSKFKTNIVEKLPGGICSYCDITDIKLPLNSEIDHFLPISEYPYLSMNFLNLTVCCRNCNGMHTGKGSTVILPITNIQTRCIGKRTKFHTDFTSISIDSKIREDNNFIKLLKLKDTYNLKVIVSDIQIKYERFITILKSVHKEDRKKTVKLLVSCDEPYYFILKSLVNRSLSELD